MQSILPLWVYAAASGVNLIPNVTFPQTHDTVTAWGGGDGGHDSDGDGKELKFSKR